MMRIPKQDRVLNFDLKNVISDNKIVGLWRLMNGYQWHYLAATLLVGLAAL